MSSTEPVNSSTPAGDEELQKKEADGVAQLIDKIGDLPTVASKNVEPPPRCQLEEYKKCSESHLWKLMMSFYDKKGVDSWSQGIVPHFITCNSFIGRSYAKTLVGFLQDSMKGGPTKVDPEEPMYVIELGTGAGKFGFFMLNALKHFEATCPFPIKKIVYVMTDFTKENFKFWTSHPALKDYVESGQLDFAIFDAVADKEIKLHRSGVVLKPSSCKNPVCIVANYLFDTLYHDVFQVDSDGLKEGLISVGSKRKEEPDPLDPEIIKRLDCKYHYNCIGDDYYKDEDDDGPHFERILAWYRANFKDEAEGASILVPIGALRALRHLTAFSDGRAIVISGDKGHNNPDQFRGLSDPHIAVHGSFSVMVNYHAIGMYFTSRGGFALHNPQEEASLKVSTFVLHPETVDAKDTEPEDWLGENVNVRDEMRAKAYPFLHKEFVDSIETFGPNDFFVMQKSMKEDAPTPNLKSVVALLKLGHWDPDVFYKFRDTILDQVPTCGTKLRNDLCRGVPVVWENYFQLDPDKDIAFEIGRFYYGIRDYANALKFYGTSVEQIGEHHVTCHNMGLCHYSMEAPEEALKHFNLSLKLQPAYEKARSWRDRVNTELRNKTSGNGNGTADPGQVNFSMADGTTTIVRGDVAITDLEVSDLDAGETSSVTPTAAAVPVAVPVVTEAVPPPTPPAGQN